MMLIAIAAVVSGNHDGVGPLDRIADYLMVEGGGTRTIADAVADLADRMR